MSPGRLWGPAGGTLDKWRYDRTVIPGAFVYAPEGRSNGGAKILHHYGYAMPLRCVNIFHHRRNKRRCRNEYHPMMDTRESKWSEAMRAERRGDCAAYEAFLRDFAAYLRRIVETRLRRMQFNAAEAEDIVQDVLIAVHTRRDQWDPKRPLLPWLNAITRYKVIDSSRRLRRDASVRIELTDEEWSRMFTFDAASLEHNAADVERLISELPRSEQAAVRAIGLEGASTREAAERLGSSEGAIRVAFHRSLKKLMAAAQKRL